MTASQETSTKPPKPKAKKQQPKSGKAAPRTKEAMLIDLLKRNRGASLAELSEATGWQAHSVRGAISGALRKKRGLEIESTVENKRGRVYRITGTK